MYWQNAISNPTNVDAAAARLLDALERVRPLRDIESNQPVGARQVALGRWLLESGQDGAIGDDTVTWLHRILLPRAA